MPFSGTVTRRRRFKHTLNGSVSFFGNIGTGTKFKRTVGGVLTFAGNITTLAGQRVLSGVIMFSGSVTRVVNGVPVVLGKSASIVLGKIKGMFLSKDIFL